MLPNPSNSKPEHEKFKRGMDTPCQELDLDPSFEVKGLSLFKKEWTRIEP